MKTYLDQALAAVDSARVHLAIPKQSVFMREQQKPSASVLVNLYPGRTLDPQQVNAIVHLVSSSVPNLHVKNVTVVDQQGDLLFARGAANEKTRLQILRRVAGVRRGHTDNGANRQRDDSFAGPHSAEHQKNQ